MSEDINIFEKTIRPAMPHVIPSQSIMVYIPIADGNTPGILTANSSYFYINEGVLNFNSSTEAAVLGMSDVLSRMSTVELSVAELGANVSYLGNSISDVYQSISSINTHLDNINNDLGALYSVTDLHTSQIADIQSEMATASYTGRYISVNIDTSTYSMTTYLLNKDNSILSQSTVDLPLEEMVVSASYYSQNLIIYTKNGGSLTVPIGDLVDGLQTEITASNKLNADLVDDSNTTNKFVTTQLISEIGSNTAVRHTHSNKTLLDTYTVTNLSLQSAVSMMHTHPNKSLLDTYTQTEVALSSAVALRHSHSNKAVLDGITEQDLSNLSILDKVIEGSYHFGTLDYMELINQPIQDENGFMISHGVLLENAYIKQADTLSITTTPVSIGTSRMYFNPYKDITFPSVFGPAIPELSGKPIYNAYDMWKDLILNGGAEIDEDAFALNTSALSQNELGVIAGISLSNGNYVLYTNGFASTPSQNYQMIIALEGSNKITDFSSETLTSWAESASTYLIYDEFRNISDGSLASFNWYTPSTNPYRIRESGMYYYLDMNGGNIDEIYNSQFLNDNFGETIQYFSMGSIVNIQNMSASPLATEYKVQSMIDETLGQIESILSTI